MQMLRIVLTALGVVKAAVQWFREQSPDDVAIKNRRLLK